jgi:hypothetical protein
MSPARAIIDAAMSEREFATIFEDMLHRADYGFYHPHDARRSQTTLDYVCWRKRVFWAELKTQKGRLSQDRWVQDRYGRMYFIKGQTTVINELRAAGQTVYIWRPSDLPTIARVLFGEAVDPLPTERGEDPLHVDAVASHGKGSSHTASGEGTGKGSTGAQVL